ncbi:MAG: hypothetical protein LBE84_10450 [Planctomycetota bacterium]|jgi:Spy/CpxP family protein refolding chaperone|nr:hypothetical protein [Planctomycetota bacterium]
MFQKSVAAFAVVLSLALLAADSPAGERRPGGRDGWRGPRQGRFRDGRKGERGPGEWDGRHPGRFRDGWTRRGGSRFHGFLPRPLPIADLELDAGQKAKIVELLTASFKSGLEIRLEIREIERRLEKLRETPSVAGDDIVTANADLGRARGKLEALATGTRREIRAVLTPEQVEQMNDSSKRRPGYPCGPGRWGCFPPADPEDDGGSEEDGEE